MKDSELILCCGRSVSKVEILCRNVGLILKETGIRISALKIDNGGLFERLSSHYSTSVADFLTSTDSVENIL